MRTAPFELPYVLSGLYCTEAVSMLQSDNMVAEFPAVLVQAIYDGSGIFGSGYTITQDDVDGLSDTAWNYLKQKLAIQS